jgi:predicted RNA-binding Zn-ribbon protein involved in translation (DUF1610 family)
MQSKSLLPRLFAQRMAVGGGAGGGPTPVVVLTVIVMAMALITAWHTAFSTSNGVDPKKEIPFKCKACGVVVMKTLGELRQMETQQTMETQDPTGMPMGMPMGPMKLVCPSCGQEELTQAVQCPECNEVFIYEIDMANPQAMNDKCPKCGVSYAEAWQKKYAKEKR